MPEWPKDWPGLKRPRKKRGEVAPVKTGFLWTPEGLENSLTYPGLMPVERTRWSNIGLVDLKPFEL